MAAFDPQDQKLVARVVYDGPPRAGKTTNLRELCRFFAVTRRGEVYTPAEDQGRTLFFDGLQLECGYVGGRALRCQLVSVPGQQEYAPRRSRLLRDADAVVFVCESTPDEVRQARRGFDMLREYLARARRADVPVVLQANKQDVAGALPAEEVRALLGMPRSIESVAARATQGEGVREALVLAVRGVTGRLQRALSDGGTGALSREVATPEALYRELCELDAARPRAPAPEDTGGEPALALSPRAPALEPRPPEASLAPPAPTSPGDVTGARAPDATRARARTEVTLPGADVPAGCVWPVIAGRAVLAALAGETPLARGDLAVSLAGGAPRRPRHLVYHLGPWRLASAERWSYADPDEGRAVLRAHAQRRQLLGATLCPEAALALARDERGGRFWLWTIGRHRTTLQAAMVRASGRRDEAALAEALVRFADAVVHVVALAQWHGVALDLHPSNFGTTDEGAVVYLDDFIDGAPQDVDAAQSLLQRFEEYAHAPRVAAAYLAGVERALARAQGQGLDAAALARALAVAPAHSPAARAARAQLAAVLDQGRDARGVAR